MSKPLTSIQQPAASRCPPQASLARVRLRHSHRLAPTVAQAMTDAEQKSEKSTIARLHFYESYSSPQPTEHATTAAGSQSCVSTDCANDDNICY